MSSKAIRHRKSIAVVKKDAEIDLSIADNKRRQTIADIVMKENLGDVTGESKSSNKEPTKRPSSDSSPFKSHHSSVSLGAAASYYFKGVPQTPVQKMIRTEQQKLLLQASMHAEDEENTGSILVNQSYLSSSSSSGGRNSSRDESEVLNNSVLSDTTELTASNFLVLAGTHRTTAEDIRKIADEQQRHPLSTIVHIAEESVPISKQVVNHSKRRQSVAEGVNAQQKPINENKTQPRRRETMSTVPIPRATSSPIELPAIIPKAQQSQQRERNKVADYQRRLSDSSFNSNVPAKASTRRRSSIAPNLAVDGTTELSISSSDMKKLLSKSVHNYDQTENVSSLPIASNQSSLYIAKNDVEKNDDASMVLELESAITSNVSKSPSPCRDNIDSTNINVNNVKGSIDAKDDFVFSSPARNTRSATKKATATDTASLERQDEALFLSPPKNPRRRTPMKSPQALQDNPVDGNLFLLSPAKSTRSATKKLLVESLSVMDTKTSTSVVSRTNDTTVSIGDLLAGVNPIFDSKKLQDNTTTSLGDLLDEVMHRDDARLDTSVTPTARNTRSAQKERTESIATVLDNVALSPARSTRSSVKKCNESIAMTVDHLASSPARSTRSSQRQKNTTPVDFDDTSQLLLALASVKPTDGSHERSNEAKTVADDVAPEGKDILNDLVDKYALVDSKLQPSETPTRNVDTSQESTISLNDLLIDYLPKSQTEGDVSRPSVVVGCSDDRESVSSVFVRSAVSKASTIDTPQNMSTDDRYVHLNGNTVAHSPPSTIRFTAIEDIYVEESLIAPSPLRKALKPSRLSPSPRRFIHSSNQKKSPFKPGLTPSRLQASPYRLANPNVSRADSIQHRFSTTPKRGFEKATDEREPTSASKRQKTFKELQGLARDSLVANEIAPSSVGRNAVLQSALRQPGHVSIRSGVKKVEFRSPTFAQYNKLSPAENVTPLFSRHSSFSAQMYDNTADIEADMHSLMNSNVVNTEGAGRTPGAKHRLQRNDSIDDSNMSFDSATLPLAPIEPTMTLETDMFSLLQNAPQVQESKMQYDEENTIELETDINALLNIPTTGHNDSIHVGRRSLVFDNEPTVELESDINLLFANDGSDSSTKQPPIESRRFSIVPSRRLSVSLDGSFDHKKSENSAVVPVCHDEHIFSKEDIFDLKVGDIIDFSLFQSLDAPNETDFLRYVERVMRENCVSDTMMSFTKEVLKMIESQTDSDLDPNAVLEINEDNAGHYNALQQHFRCGDKESIRCEMKTLVSSLHAIDKFEWLQWLVAATEQLSRPMGKKSDQLIDEIERIDQLCIDMEQCLASVTSKSVQRARKKGTANRTDEIVSLESEISTLESEIHQLQRCLDEILNEAATLSALEGAIKDNESLSLSLSDGEKLATTYERKCNTLKGAAKFKPVILKNTEFSFAYLGSSPKTCVDLSFSISSPTSISIAATVDPSLFEKRGTLEAKKLATVSSFLQIRMNSFCDFARQHVLSDMRDIPSYLRRFDFRIGRLESAATELAKLNERYRGKVSLINIANSSTFQLTISFRGRTGLAQLEASFEVSEAYPFSPLSVCLDSFDSKINVEAIRKLMVKNAKPGFGYLSRICDVVEASLPST